MSKIESAIGVIDGASEGVGSDVGDSVGAGVDVEHAVRIRSAASASLIS
jgi:hypothetical protein